MLFIHICVCDQNFKVDWFNFRKKNTSNYFNNRIRNLNCIHAYFFILPLLGNWKWLHYVNFWNKLSWTSTQWAAWQLEEVEGNALQLCNLRSFAAHKIDSRCFLFIIVRQSLTVNESLLNELREIYIYFSLSLVHLFCMSLPLASLPLIAVDDREELWHDEIALWVLCTVDKLLDSNYRLPRKYD